MKLSKRQQEVIDLLTQGWELGCSQGWTRPLCWMQKNGLGKGGPYKPIHRSTVRSLWKRELIEYVHKEKDGYNLTRYKLKENQ